MVNTIKSTLTISISGGVNLGLSGASSSLPSARIYYSQIQLEPIKAITYVNENTNKKIVYITVLNNEYNNISGTLTSLLILV